MTRRNPSRLDRPTGGLLRVLSALVAARFVHLTAHWRARGVTSFGDHKMFETLYKDIDDQIDRLAERIVTLGGVENLQHAHLLQSALDQVKDTGTFRPTSPPDGTSLAARSLLLELALLDAINDARRDPTTPGVDNLLQGFYDAHEAVIYHLRQRIS